MQSLQQKASEWSGVDQEDAFSIDEVNLFEKLGLQTFINLSTDFYTRYSFSNPTLLFGGMRIIIVLLDGFSVKSVKIHSCASIIIVLCVIWGPC